MDALCLCGEPAVWFMDPDGNPLVHPRCDDCYAWWVTTQWKPEEEED